MIHFEEHPQPGYAPRTIRNVSLANLTLAFAVDFNTAGERLTKRVANTYGSKIYIPVDLNYILSGSAVDFHKALAYTKAFILQFKLPEIHLNVAGNGLYTILTKTGHNIEQGYIDLYLGDFLTELTALNLPVKSIRSGGQTGVDEAALKAAEALQIPAFCCAPKGWMFRDINGTDIRNKEKFLNRFGEIYNIVY